MSENRTDAVEWSNGEWIIDHTVPWRILRARQEKLSDERLTFRDIFGEDIADD